MKEKIKLSNKTILVTGVSGFIGAKLCERLLVNNEETIIVGIDNKNDVSVQ